jgi:NHL repeat
MRTARIVPVTLVAVALSLFGATSASASITQIASFGTTGPGALKGAEGIAVNANTNNVYVTDKLDHRVVEYDQEGNFILTFGREVNETKTREKLGGDTQITEAEENVCTAASGNTCLDGVAGSETGQLDWPTGIAIDPTTGDVYVSDGGNERIEKYTSEGAYISQIVSGQNGAPRFVLGVTFENYNYKTFEFTSHGNDSWVDDEGNLYLSSPDEVLRGFVYKFTPAGEFTGETFLPSNGTHTWALVGGPSAVVVAPTGDVDVSEAAKGTGSGGILQFAAASGSEIGTFTNDLASYCSKEYEYRAKNGVLEPLAINLSTGEVFNAGFNASCEPVVRVLAPSNGQLTQLSEFPIQPEAFTPPPQALRGVGAHPFVYQSIAYAAGVGKLYQLTGGQETDEVAVYGTFPLPVPAAPVVSSENWSDLGLSSVVLHAKIDPDSVDTIYQIEYGTDPDLSGATSVPVSPVDAGAGFLPVNVSQTVSGLSQSTVYYYRVVAHSSFGAGTTVDGPIQSVTTLAPLPSAVTEGPSEVSSTNAVVNGTVTPGSTGAASATMWCFQYGATELPGYNLGFMPGQPAGSAGQGTSPVQLSERLAHLQPNTTYRYRLVAVNSLGSRLSSTACSTEGGQESDGAEQTFTTPNGDLVPLVSTGAVLGVTENTATLTGTLDPEGVHTIYEFQLGTSTQYGVELFADAGNGGQPEQVSVVVSSLQPGTAYHYRLVATNAYGTSYGADGTFTTVSVPSAILGAPPTPPLIGTPDIAFPAEVTGSTTTRKTTPKCKKPKKLSHGKCVKSKTKKQAKKASRSRKER